MTSYRKLSPFIRQGAKPAVGTAAAAPEANDDQDEDIGGQQHNSKP